MAARMNGQASRTIATSGCFGSVARWLANNDPADQEIGEIMERSEGAIKSLYHRTLLALREELTGSQPDEPARQAKWNQPR